MIAVSRSALSVILLLKEGKVFGECQKVSKMLKVIFNPRATFPKFTIIYDPDIFRYMDMLPNNSSLLLEDLTKKLCTLCLLSSRRCQTIASLDQNFSIHSSEKFTFAINKVMKMRKLRKGQLPGE